MAKLSDLLIDEVSLVRKGANQHAHVAIAKSADDIPGGTVEEYFDVDGNPVDANELEDGQIVFDENGTAYQYDENADAADVDEEDLELVGKSFGSSLRGARDLGRLAAGDARTFAGSVPMRGKRAYIKGGAKAGQAARRVGTGVSNGAGAVGTKAGNVANAARNGAGSAQNAVAGFARSPGGRAGIAGALGLGAGGAGGYAGGRRVSKSFEQDIRVELSKALTDEDRDAVLSKAFGYMDELAAEVSKAQQLAEEEREARLDAEYLDVAKSYTLPVSDEELADALRAMAEALDPEQVAVVQKCLEIASDAMEAEFGAAGGGANDDIMAQVNAQAEQFARRNGDVAKSFESATTDVFSVNPDAYDLYLQDNPAQLGR